MGMHTYGKRARLAVAMTAAVSIFALVVSACGSGGGSNEATSSDTSSSAAAPVESSSAESSAETSSEPAESSAESSAETSSAAPESSTEAPALDLSGMTFAFGLATMANPLIVTQGQLFKEGAEKLGAKVTLYDNKGTAEDMLSNAKLMVAAKPDVIVEYPSVADATARVSQMFKDAGIPCISVNVAVEGCPLFNFDQPSLAALGAQAMADQMKARNWDGSNTTVVIGQAAQYGPSVNIAVTAFYDKLSQLVPNMTHVASGDISTSTTTISGEQGLQVDLGFTADVAFPAITRALQSIPEGRNIVVYTTADDVTVAVRRAIANANRTDKSMVSGFGGDGDAIKALREGGDWVTEQTGFFGNWGEFVLAMAVAMKNGVTLPELTQPPVTVLTKDNVDTYFKAGTTDLIMMPALPEVSSYLYDTGVLQSFGNVTIP